MSRVQCNTLARANGGRLYMSDESTGWYLFKNDDQVIAFREQVPFLSLWQGRFDGGQMLIVYFDQAKA